MKKHEYLRILSINFLVIIISGSGEGNSLSTRNNLLLYYPIDSESADGTITVSMLILL